MRHIKPRMIILGDDFESLSVCNKGFLNEPAVSHKEPGAADHSSVEWDVMFDQILSMLGLCPSNYLLLVIVNINHSMSFFFGTIRIKVTPIV